MPNHLINETSPYLLQHAHNPVDWYPWGMDALSRARSENKPIFLSIGYAACHWCHVMADESFEDSEIARLMNNGFICIKVDREERPDLDSIYMQATTTLTGSGGWPMSVFLTPDLQPFYAGTYFPPVRRYNLPSFKEILLSISRLWAENKGEAELVGERVTAHLQHPVEGSKAGVISEESLEESTKLLLDEYDWEFGGWGSAPKFPQPMLIEFLLRRAISKAPFHDKALNAALNALKAMARGGMYDVVGGGFARYSTDNSWHIPHFEKMLYDNALMARAYLHAWQITKDPFYKQITTETLDFVIRELTHPEGGFFSSLDADSEGKEGSFYLWSIDQLKQILSEKNDLDLFIAAYGLNKTSNSNDAIVLQRSLDNARLAARMETDEVHAEETLAHCHALLLIVRNERIHPSTDDKVLTGWNGLMLETFAEAARYIDDKEKASKYAGMATRNAEFLLNSLRSDGQLARVWRNGKVKKDVFLEDYGALILGLLALYQTSFDNRWFTAACELTAEMIERFVDASGGYFDTPENAGTLLVRPKDVQDNATPSGNSLACQALLSLAMLTNQGEYRDQAEAALTLVSELTQRFPTAFANSLCAIDQALNIPKQVAILIKQGDQEVNSMIEVIRSSYRPNIVVAASNYPPSDDAPTLLRDRPLREGKTTAYVCEHFVCKQPVITTPDLARQL